MHLFSAYQLSNFPFGEPSSEIFLSNNDLEIEEIIVKLTSVQLHWKTLKRFVSSSSLTDLF